ncbi:MAG TPA: type II CAAX endopeptidase family protein [Terriglobia bacterium]|nr:type II CAAX endopeptidase family protein [Terriglobia bacterium]
MIFLNDKNEVRAGFKFAIYVGFFLIFWVATGLALSIVVYQFPDVFTYNQLAVLALNEIALLVPAVVAMALTIRFVDHRPRQAFGIAFLPRWQCLLIFGLLLAAGMLGVLLVFCKIAGQLSIQWTGGQTSSGKLAATFGLLFLAALNEELVFRCFPLQLLMDGMGEWPGMIAMSILFGAVHMNNPNASVLGTVNTMLAGVLLSLAYARTRSLWLPYAIHVGWNLGLGFVLGFALSGLDIASLWTTNVTGSDLLLGGKYGPEGGLVATFIFAASAVFIHQTQYIAAAKRQLTT